MSLLVNGTLAARVARTEEPATRISASFVQLHFPPSQHSSTHLPVLVSCDVSADLDFDVVLGLNWKAYSHELLLRSGYSVPVNFDPWSLLPSGVSVMYPDPWRVWLMLLSSQYLSCVPPHRQHYQTAEVHFCRILQSSMKLLLRLLINLFTVYRRRYLFPGARGPR
ncbi:hypothetical protein R3P38DRAFT_2816057 [Favolaschia claudopus]|uniref:Uncharacterized protein n=1 Tax=Favolaschia claudopus TaxID=2862362 RepID=A0AAV9YZT2_9AGAR